MAKNLNDETWRKLLEEFSSYEGTVSSFCKKIILARGSSTIIK